MDGDASFLIEALRGEVARARVRRLLALQRKPPPVYKLRKLARARVDQVSAAHAAIADRFRGLQVLASFQPDTTGMH